jgi:hypothetical protein
LEFLTGLGGERPVTDELCYPTVAQPCSRETWRRDYHLALRLDSAVAAGPENVRRVAAKLAAAGWPLAGVDRRG